MSPFLQYFTRQALSSPEKRERGNRLRLQEVEREKVERKKSREETERKIREETGRTRQEEAERCSRRRKSREDTTI